jgi:hypothetical protein
MVSAGDVALERVFPMASRLGVNGTWPESIQKGKWVGQLKRRSKGKIAGK